MLRYGLICTIIVMSVLGCGCQNIPVDVFEHSKEAVKKDDPSIIPIVVNGAVIGGYRNGTWLDPEAVYSKITDRQYKIYSFDEALGKGAGTIPESREKQAVYAIDMTGVDKDEDYTALACSWDAMPRIAKEKSILGQKSTSAMRNILRDNGISRNTPIKIKQILVADMEGDGTDETIVLAENISPLTSVLSNNSYSFLVVRKEMDEETLSIIVHKETAPDDPEQSESMAVTYSVKSVLDLNGDGKLEILVHSQYYDGEGYQIYGINGNQAKLLLESANVGSL
ncbi:MAG: hypothetical protein ACM3UZ_08245 [Acidobacteriota bacterium]